MLHTGAALVEGFFVYVYDMGGEGEEGRKEERKREEGGKKKGGRGVSSEG